MFSIGSTARVKRIIPIPPIKCDMARHIRIPCEQFSTSVITEAPVVVIPETDSKKADATFSPVGHKIKGRVPKMEQSCQVIPVRRKP